MPRQTPIQPVVLTTPGRRAAHVADIVAAFSGRAGFAAPLVYCDERGDGAAVSTREALAAAAAASGGGPVLFVEDDVLVDRSAPPAVASAVFPPGVAVISFCDMREVAEFSPPGLYTRSPLASDGRGWWGNQALLLHPETVAMCTREDWFSRDIEESWGVCVHKATYGDGGRNCSDIRLALLVHGRGGDRRLYAVHVPSVFRHVGHVSACFPGRGMGERETRNWVADRRRFGVDVGLAGGGPGTSPAGPAAGRDAEPHRAVTSRRESSG